jgi:hypothetical protein
MALIGECMLLVGECMVLNRGVHGFSRGEGGECMVFSQWLVSRKHDLNQGSARILFELGLVTGSLLMCRFFEPGTSASQQSTSVDNLRMPNSNSLATPLPDLSTPYSIVLTEISFFLVHFLYSF